MGGGGCYEWKERGGETAAGSAFRTMDADKVLDSLFATLSRGSIAYESAAEELAMSFGSDKFGEVSDAIAEQVGKVPLARRLAYLQCLDLITRKIRERFGCDSDEYKDWTKRLGATLYGFLHKLIPSGNEASESPKVVEQNFKVCKEVVKKWRKSGEFNGAAMLANAEKFLDSCKARVFTRSNSSGRDSKHSGEDSRRKEIDSVLGLSEEEATRYIEAERSKQKRRRFYGSLRQSEADEFWELWGRCETAETPEQLFNAGLGPFCIPRFDERAFSEACGNLHLSKRKHCVFIWSLDDCLILFNSLLNPELYPRIKYVTMLSL